MLLALLMVWAGTCCSGQDYKTEIAQFRKNYLQELADEERQPVKKADMKFIRFFEPDSSYRVSAAFTPTLGSQPFLIPTHSGKQKPYKEYGVLTFSLRDTTYTLHVYQSLDLINNKQYQHHLFLPFKDLTNYETTYAGGRYIDLKTTDIIDGQVVIDFNKCYNPYCAFGEGYSCPIPPSENYLATVIAAGEKMFAKYQSE